MKAAMIFGVAALLALAPAARLSAVEPADAPPGVRALLAAYPEQLAGYQDGKIVWRDGTTMPFEDGHPAGSKSTAELFETASLADQLSLHYPAGREYPNPPPHDFDPGRYRCEPFFLRGRIDNQSCDA